MGIQAGSTVAAALALVHVVLDAGAFRDGHDFDYTSAAATPTVDPTAVRGEDIRVLPDSSKPFIESIAVCAALSVAYWTYAVPLGLPCC